MRELTLEALGDVAVARRRTELVERKGLGHPDSVCDALVETASLALGRMYLERTGRILHYNLDKALLVAGECPKGFGWGELTRPMELIVGDRATFTVDGTTLPVEDVVRGAVDAWVAAYLPHVRPGRDLMTRVVLAPGSEELIRIFHVDVRAIRFGSGARCWLGIGYVATFLAQAQAFPPYCLAQLPLADDDALPLFLIEARGWEPVGGDHARASCRVTKPPTAR